MKSILGYGVVLLAVMAGSPALAGNKNGFFLNSAERRLGGETNKQELNAKDWRDIKKYAGENLHGLYFPEPGIFDEIVQGPDPVADYETSLPNEGMRHISKIESKLLIRYLENPSDSRAALIMAVYHLLHSAVAGGHGIGKNIDRIQRTIYAQYFLLRAKQLGERKGWIGRAIQSTEGQLAVMLPTHRPLDMTEGNQAHDYFLEAFNQKEENRYEAEDRLLKDLLKNPTSLLTNLYVSAVNLWNAGEAGYDDPAILYSFVKASYFGKRATELSRRAEQEWESDPDNHSLFRLAPTVGGFSIPSRRWLAEFQGDTEAVALLDAEIEQWRVKYPVFYMFPASVSSFTEPDNYFNGFLALLAAFDKCVNEPNIFCQDHPRVTYNNISFFIYAFDYFMKVGDTGSALAMLDFKYVPVFRYDTWTLGHDAWRHREENLDMIAELYQNGDPADDPINVFLRRHKWGPESSTCQLCHQVQGASWTDEEKETPVELDEAARYVQDWPESKVSWFGSVMENAE